MIKHVLHFSLGFVTAAIFLVGIAAAGYILYEHYQVLYPVIIAGMLALLPINIVVFLYCPKVLKWGAALPQVIALGVIGYFVGNSEIKPFFTDDVAYHSCVGNFDHGQGISDCSALIFKLENDGEIVLKDIENTKGDYWLAELLSYRGRHYFRNDQSQFGKEDFARAFLLPEGGAVVAGNLADVGFTRQELFEPDYEKELAKLLDLIKQEGVVSLEGASNFLIAQLGVAAEKCRLSTGREAKDCREIILNGVFPN